MLWLLIWASEFPLYLIVLLLVGWLILALPSVSSLHSNRHQCHDSQRDQLRRVEELRRDLGQIPESSDVQVRDAAHGPAVAAAADGRILRKGLDPIPRPARVPRVHRRAAPETPLLEQREQGGRCEGRRGRERS